MRPPRAGRRPLTSRWLQTCGTVFQICPYGRAPDLRCAPSGVLQAKRRTRLKWVSSSNASSALGRSRSTPGWGCTPRTVTNLKGGCSDGSRRFIASCNVLEMKALMLMPRAAAARRTCFASWSSSEIVVLMMRYHNFSSSVNQRINVSRTPLHRPLTAGGLHPGALDSRRGSGRTCRTRVRWGLFLRVQSLIRAG